MSGFFSREFFFCLSWADAAPKKCGEVRKSVKNFVFFFSSIYPVGKVFCLIQTVDGSKHYAPENKIIIDVPTAVKIFDDKVGVVQHVKDLTRELCDAWNDKYHNQPQASFQEYKNLK